ncbi:serine aminopeptidase domain-containing protein [Shivajiella indica]|uniref:Serine aminopeptidase domain-containing protein n=1 Tax=Shivajiella indica TaxID=872115 RepID=A0ABW5BGI9_9BACT
MKIHRTSSFKNPVQDHLWFRNWVERLEMANGRKYGEKVIHTSLGKTQIWTLKDFDPKKETLLVFPGARTTVLFWDLDKNLNALVDHVNIFLVETNGLPNLSDGNTPDIKGNGYGSWAKEIVDNLELDKVFVAGASFGGLICMKMALVCPERIHTVFLLNPGCLQPFSLRFKNLYYNLLPIFSPTEKNVRKFLYQAILCYPHHSLSKEAEQLLVDYEVFAIRNYKDNTQKPYDMGMELTGVTVPVYLLLGDKDLLFPYQKSAKNAVDSFSKLQEIKVFENVGHGIETFLPTFLYIRDTLIKSNKNNDQ